MYYPLISIQSNNYIVLKNNVLFQEGLSLNAMINYGGGVLGLNY